MGFPLAIFAAALLGVFFPYTALALAPYGFVFLALLMAGAGIAVDTNRLRRASGRWPALLLGIFLAHIFLPLVFLTLAQLLLRDPQYIFGAYFAALAPVAIVAPFFTKLAGGDEEFAYLLMILSSVVYPVAAIGLLWALPTAGMRVEVMALAKGMLLMVLLPAAVSALLARFFPALRKLALPYVPTLNAACLAALVFTLFGAAMGRLNFSYLEVQELVILLGLAFLQDFGVLFLLPYCLRPFFSAKDVKALAVTLAMKNTAVAAGLLLFFSPRAAVPAALVFLPHALLWGWIPWRAKNKK